MEVEDYELLDRQAKLLLEKDERIAELEGRLERTMAKLAIVQNHLIERKGGWVKKEYREDK